MFGQCLQQQLNLYRGRCATFLGDGKLNKNELMKKIFTIIFLLSFCSCISQTTKENKIITRINNQILSSKVVKKEIYKQIGWHGGYEKTTVYLKNNIPILIEKEEKEVIHEYLTDGSEKDQINYITAKFYITNWKKNDFIRIGEITNLEEKALGEIKKYITELPKKYIFNFERNEIEKLIQ